MIVAPQARCNATRPWPYPPNEDGVGRELGPVVADNHLRFPSQQHVQAAIAKAPPLVRDRGALVQAIGQQAGALPSRLVVTVEREGPSSGTDQGINVGIRRPEGVLRDRSFANRTLKPEQSSLSDIFYVHSNVLPILRLNMIPQCVEVYCLHSDTTIGVFGADPTVHKNLF